jgi:hypothetical protein
MEIQPAASALRWGELASAILAEGVEEALQGVLVAAWRGPHQPPQVMVDDHRQVAVALLVADLVHADPAQPLEPVDLGGLLGGDPRADPADRAPGNAQQLPDRRPGGMHRQPRRGVLEATGEPGAGPGPRYCRDDHAVLGQQTLGASASRNTWTTPRSSARQRRRPSPWS